MPFPPKVREDALLASGRHCSLCHKFCGTKIELHHIVQKTEGGQDNFENCIPLCFDCHADMRSYDHKHPKGTKYTSHELKRHRDNWYEKVRASPNPTYDQKSLELDKAVYVAILKPIPYNTVMRRIEEYDFIEPFPVSIFEALDKFYDANKNPSNEFIDADLESLRVQLDASVAEFANYLALNTFRCGTNMQSVPSEWEVTQPERMRKVAEALEKKSTNVSIVYRALVREARRRLSVISDCNAD